MLIVGAVLIAVGLSDLLVSGLLARRGRTGQGGLGVEDRPPPAAAGILRALAFVTVLVGVVLVVLGVVA